MSNEYFGLPAARRDALIARDKQAAEMTMIRDYDAYIAEQELMSDRAIEDLVDNMIAEGELMSDAWHAWEEERAYA